MIEQFRLAFPSKQGNWQPGMGAEQEYAKELSERAEWRCRDVITV